MTTRKHAALASPGRPPAEAVDADSWQRPVAALGKPDEPGTGPLIDDAWLGDLTAGQQRIVAAVFRHIGCDATSAMATVEEQRTRLRAGGLRRSDDIETVTVLVRLLVGGSLDGAAAVADIHRAHQCLRRLHWWPSGPEDLPLAALLVASDTTPDDAVADIGDLHRHLSEGDEVPDDPAALVVLSRGISGCAAADAVTRMRALRTALLLSGIAVREADAAALPSLALVAGDPQEVLQEFLDERRAATGSGNARPAALAITMAADAVVLRHLVGRTRQGFIASLVVRAWMDHRRPPASSRTYARSFPAQEKP